MPDLKILVSGTDKDLIFSLKALSEGASGFINKDEHESEHIRGINKVLSGDKFLSKILIDFTNDILNGKSGTDSHNFCKLYFEEIEILNLMSETKAII